MADFFEKKIEGDQEISMEGSQEQSVEIPKIKVGEEEFSQQELSQLVGLGKIGRELESKWNTKIDRVYPEFTKAQNELKQLREYTQSNSQPTIPTDDSIRQARAAAQKIGIVTQEDFSNYMSQHFRQFYVNERAAERLLEETEDLERKYSGTDGRPAFRQSEILQYMQETGIRNPEKAYKDKYESQLDAWKESHLNKAKTPGLYTQETGGASSRSPSEVKPTRDNLHALITEAMGG